MKYRNQSIEIQESSSLNKLIIDNLQNSTLLLWNLIPSIDKEEFVFLIDRVSNFFPLSIAVAGNDNDLLFDWLLLDVLAPKFEDNDPEETHIMTWLIDSNDTNEIIPEFFDLVEPSTPRFDEWQYYKIILLGDTNSTKIIKESILAWLGSQKNASL
jgi:hypothetical protein